MNLNLPEIWESLVSVWMEWVKLSKWKEERLVALDKEMWAVAHGAEWVHSYGDKLSEDWGEVYLKGLDMRLGSWLYGGEEMSLE